MNNTVRIPIETAIRIIPDLCVGTRAHAGHVLGRDVLTMVTPDGEVWPDGSLHDVVDHFPIDAHGLVSFNVIRLALGY